MVRRKKAVRATHTRGKEVKCTCVCPPSRSNFLLDYNKPDEPDEDDITTSDHHRWYLSGRLYFEGDERGLRRKMDKDSYWPNVWFISDHGNAHLLTPE